MFAIRGFEVKGANSLGDGEIDTLLAPYMRTNATLSTLQDATAAPEKALRQLGIRPTPDGAAAAKVRSTVQLQVFTFTISEVDVEGRSIYSEDVADMGVSGSVEVTHPSSRPDCVRWGSSMPARSKQLRVRHHQAGVGPTAPAGRARSPSPSTTDAGSTAARCRSTSTASRRSAGPAST